MRKQLNIHSKQRSTITHKNTFNLFVCLGLFDVKAPNPLNWLKIRTNDDIIKTYINAV